MTYTVKISGAVVTDITKIEVTSMDTGKSWVMDGKEYFETFGQDDGRWFLEGAPHMIAVPLH